MYRLFHFSPDAPEGDGLVPHTIFALIIDSYNKIGGKGIWYYVSSNVNFEVILLVGLLNSCRLKGNHRTIYDDSRIRTEAKQICLWLKLDKKLAANLPAVRGVHAPNARAISIHFRHIKPFSKNVAVTNGKYIIRIHRHALLNGW